MKKYYCNDCGASFPIKPNTCSGHQSDNRSGWTEIDEPVSALETLAQAILEGRVSLEPRDSIGALINYPQIVKMWDKDGNEVAL